nr:hypothetical protein [Tanacetum cinerariifolium]
MNTAGANLYGARATGVTTGIKLIWNYTWRIGGGPVPGQMTYLVASMTLDSVRSCVMQGAFFTHGKASSIPTVFSWGGNISPKGFLPSILLLAVIIVAVAIVVTVVLIVVDTIIRVVVSDCKIHLLLDLSSGTILLYQELLEFRPGDLLLRENTDSVRLNQQMSPTAPSVPLKLKVFAMLAACASSNNISN